MTENGKLFRDSSLVTIKPRDQERVTSAAVAGPSNFTPINKGENVATYHALGTNFHVKKLGSFSGQVIADPDAFYLIPLEKSTNTAIAAQFGLLGLFVKYLMTRNKPIKIQHQYAIGMEQIPVELTSHPEWPVKKHRERLLVLPRPIIKSLKYSWGSFRLDTEACPITFSPPAFGKKKTITKMQELGWELSQ